MGTFEDLNIAGLQALGLNPKWVDILQANTVGAPNSASDGVFTEDSPKSLIYVALREDVSLRTSRVVIGVADLTVTVYTVIINGNSVVYDASVELPATATLLVSGIADKINADGTVGPLVTASADPDALTTTILIQGKAEPDYSINATAVGGTGTLTFNADGAGCDIRVYATPGGALASGSTGNPDRWVKPLDALYPGIDFRGFFERFDTAGLDRVYVEIENLAGHASDGGSITQNVAGTMVGPSVVEAPT